MTSMAILKLVSRFAVEFALGSLGSILSDSYKFLASYFKERRLKSRARRAEVNLGEERAKTRVLIDKAEAKRSLRKTFDKIKHPKREWKEWLKSDIENHS